MLNKGKNIRLIPFESDRHASTLYDLYYSGKYEEFFRDFPQTPTINYFESFGRAGRAFAIETLGEIVGFILIHNIQQNTRIANLGIVLTDYIQNKKYALEACYLVIKHLFEDLFLRKLVIEIVETNKTLQKYLERNNIQREAVLKQEARINGEFLDVYRYAIFEDQVKPILEKVRAFLWQ